MMKIAAVLILVAFAAQAQDDIHLFVSDVSQWVLAGQGLPPDWRSRVEAMPPGERLQALIVLRRSGLLRGATWPLEGILAPARADQE